MILKTLLDEDFVNYKVPAMVLGFPKCTFKCDKECGKEVCQNSMLTHLPHIAVEINEIVSRYTENPITSAIVFGGLEPFDSWDDMFMLIIAFRKVTSDPIIIYTGYYQNEIESKVTILKAIRNIIVKFGRYIPDDEPHFDEVLGVTLASQNQYAVQIS